MTTTTSPVFRRALTGVALLAMGWGMVQGRTQAVAQGGAYAQADSVFIDTLDVLVLATSPRRCPTVSMGVMWRSLRRVVLQQVCTLSSIRPT